jgi:hypothetical protein
VVRSLWRSVQPRPIRRAGSSSRMWNTPPAVSIFHPIGTGLFKVVEFKPTEAIKLIPLPAKLDVFSAEVIPILQRRKLFRTEYSGTMPKPLVPAISVEISEPIIEQTGHGSGHWGAPRLEQTRGASRVNLRLPARLALLADRSL